MYRISIYFFYCLCCVVEMARLLRYDGRVAIITGAGRGLGREYAMMLASRGAKVVVNDLGVDLKGLGKNSGPVDEVVSAIRKQGGIAVANYDSVEDGEKVVKTAIDNFGRVDILVNNAGIIRDKSLANLSDLDWDLVQRVHMRGSFMMTRAAWPYMKSQKYGRIIMTSSPSGIYGNFGQANYSAAKLGLVGLANTVSKEGRKYNVFTNTIAPTAVSRLTDNLVSPDIQEFMSVRDIAPVVCYLCHEGCEDNGSIIESFGGWASKVFLQKTRGVAMKEAGKPFTIEDVRDNWESIVDMTDPLYHSNTPESAAYALEKIQDKLSESGSSSGPAPSGSINDMIGFEAKPDPFTYNHREVILYALGVGAKLSPDNTSELKFLYEGHQDFSVIPSFAVIPAFAAMNGVMGRAFASSNINVHMSQILHGEQYIELMKPMPTSGTLTHKACIRDVLDKKSGAAILFDVETFDESGEQICFNQFTTFAVGAGGFGGKRTSKYNKPTKSAPDRIPDASISEKTLTTQAALYRLCVDENPLHIDPEFAAVGGYSTPILHGLCSFGHATRHVMQQYCNNNAEMIKCIKARFSKPVIPGDTLQTDMWREGNTIFFRCKVVENGNIVLSGGYAELRSAPVATATPATPSASSSMESTAIFEQMSEMIKHAGTELVSKVKAVFLWKITKDGKTEAWTVDLKTPPGSVYRGEPQGTKAGCTLTLSDENFVALVNGKINPQEAFFQGKIKISGNVMLSQKLQQLFNQQSKL